uniref:Uncharacterized protein n=1 Tax=Arundo donax TaxID=35708 RepID=A0A0A9AYH9_ARUDO
MVVIGTCKYASNPVLIALHGLGSLISAANKSLGANCICFQTEF